MSTMANKTREAASQFVNDCVPKLGISDKYIVDHYLQTAADFAQRPKSQVAKRRFDNAGRTLFRNQTSVALSTLDGEFCGTTPAVRFDLTDGTQRVIPAWQIRAAAALRAN